MFGLVCVSFLIVGLGLLNLFAPDFMWSLQVWSNEWQGRASERTELWDIGRTISGIVAIIAGIGLFLWGWSVQSQTASREAEATAVVQQQATEAVSLAGELDAVFMPLIDSLRETATETTMRASTAELGFPDAPHADVMYGRCESGGALYVLIIGYEGEDYGYTSGTSLCSILVATFRTELLGDSSARGRWYELRFFRDTSALATAAFAPLATIQAQPTVTPLGSN